MNELIKHTAENNDIIYASNEKLSMVIANYSRPKGFWLASLPGKYSEYHRIHAEGYAEFLCDCILYCEVTYEPNWLSEIKSGSGLVEDDRSFELQVSDHIYSLAVEEFFGCKWRTETDRNELPLMAAITRSDVLFHKCHLVFEETSADMILVWVANSKDASRLLNFLNNGVVNSLHEVGRVAKIEAHRYDSQVANLRMLGSHVARYQNLTENQLPASSNLRIYPAC